MKVVVQRSKNSTVSVDGQIIGSIDSGLVLLVGFTKGDSLKEIEYLSKKIVNLRIFDDENGVIGCGGFYFECFTIYLICQYHKRK